jgi:transposase
MRAAGVALNQIATFMCRTVRTISNYVAEYRSGGLTATMEDRAYRPASDVEPYWEQLKEHFEQNPASNFQPARRAG